MLEINESVTKYFTDLMTKPCEIYTVSETLNDDGTESNTTTKVKETKCAFRVMKSEEIIALSDQEQGFKTALCVRIPKDINIEKGYLIKIDNDYFKVIGIRKQHYNFETIIEVIDYEL